MRSSGPASVRSANNLRHDDVRFSIRDGDVLICRDRSLPSRLIQWVTHSRYSYAGLYIVFLGVAILTSSLRVSAHSRPTEYPQLWTGIWRRGSSATLADKNAA
ncbi:MAG: hypothetical protein H6Q05_5171 [Acidobacteria bacterium]|nr:hypothetical protein [Acidobacteriota bacterium]